MTTLQKGLVDVISHTLEQTATGRKVLAGSSTEIQGPLSGSTAAELVDRLIVPTARAQLESLYRQAGEIERALVAADRHL